MKAYVDKDLCIACGLCHSISPEVFSLDDAGKAEATDQELSKELVSAAEDAAEQCPSSAITVNK